MGGKDPLTKVPSKIQKTNFLADVYTSHWLKCIEKMLEFNDEEFLNRVTDIGYYNLYHMDTENVLFVDRKNFIKSRNVILCTE